MNRSRCGFGYQLFIAVSIFCSCDLISQGNIDSPEGYNFSAGKKLTLFSNLREISGIAFLPGSESTLMTINDEQGRIYTVNINNPGELSDIYEFAGKGDYEDITFFNGFWRVLQSNGLIFSGDFKYPDWPKPPKILPKDEYEGMVAYNDTLFVICKECKEIGNGMAQVFLIKAVNDSMRTVNTLQLDASEFLKGKQKKVFASALARHPITNEWYILSHLNSCLFITDGQFKIKQHFNLPKTLFSQPEGIAFSPVGDLYISNEGDKGLGYILAFKYKE